MVKITFKTVQNKLFTVEAEETETVGDLKKKIEESQTFPVANQKLIFSGKILQDAATVASLKVKEKDFLVVMVSKPKAAPAAAAATPAAPSTPAPAAAASAPAVAATPASPSPAGPAASAATDAPAAAAAPASDAAAPAAASFEPGGSFVAGETLQNAINEMVSMGFTRDQVQRALRASFNNPDRAMEYLFSGNIPETGGMGATPAAPAAAPSAAAAPPATPAAAPAPGAAPAPAPTPAAAPAPSTQAGSADNLFAAAEAAMNRDRGMPAAAAGRPANPAAAAMAAAGAGAGAGGLGGAGAPPSLESLREAVQQNPALIQPLIQRIAAQHPQVAQMLNENPEALYQMLGLGLEGEEDDEMMGMGGMPGQDVVQVNLTEEEAAAVARLEALGFDRSTVLQCYLACDRQEELAANMLFDFQNED